MTTHKDDLVERYAARADELSENGAYSWWSDLATLLRSQATRILELERALAGLVEDFDQRMLLGRKTDVAEVEAISRARALLEPKP